MHGYSLVRGSGGPGEGSASPVPLPRQRGSRRRKAVVALVALVVVVQAAFAWYAWGFDAAESGAQTRSGAREEARRLWEQLALAAKHRLDAGKAAWLGDGSGLIGGATGSPSVGARFELPTTPLPVHHEHARIHFNNHPLSSHRPSAHQFLLDPSAASSGRLTQAPPVVAIVTATHNPRAVLLETAASLFGQSLQSFVWLVVDDHSSDRGARRRLREVARDPRVVLLRNEGQRGLSASRNVALRWILDKEARRRDGRRPRYVTNLDDDDLFELTALEKVSRAPSFPPSVAFKSSLTLSAIAARVDARFQPRVGPGRLPVRQVWREQRDGQDGDPLWRLQLFRRECRLLSSRVSSLY